MDDTHDLRIADPSDEKPIMGMMAWMATEGGRKCPQCGRYARPSELGSIGGRCSVGGNVTIISMYGHLPGFGCNKQCQD